YRESGCRQPAVPRSRRHIVRDASRVLSLPPHPLNLLLFISRHVLELRHQTKSDGWPFRLDLCDGVRLPLRNHAFDDFVQGQSAGFLCREHGPAAPSLGSHISLTLISTSRRGDRLAVITPPRA